MSEPRSCNGAVDLPMSITDQMADAIMALDRSGRIAFWNRAAERLFRLPVADVLGRTPGEVNVYPWLRPEAEQEALAAMSATGIWRGEAVRHTRNGHAMYVESTITELIDADGAPIGLLAVIRNITKAKGAALEQEESLERLRGMLDRLKALAGLIPICSHCKRIRDEQGAWHEIEMYIGERLRMRFSHGICPACFRTLHRDCLDASATPR